MKKRILFTLLTVGLISVSSLKAQFSIGPGVVYATEIENIGISANLNYDFSEKWGAMAGYTYFFEKEESGSTGYGTITNSVKYWTLDFDGTYTLSNKDKSRLYVLAGLNMMYWDYGDGETSTSDAGFNLGAGWRYKLGKKMDLVPEARYTIRQGYGYFRIGVKLMLGL
jgi:outer membrane receptor protein involved in Fe transport